MCAGAMRRALSLRSTRYALPLLASDAVLVAIEPAVVAHRSEVEQSAALEVGDRDATRLVTGEPLAYSVRIPRVDVLAVLPQVRNRALAAGADVTPATPVAADAAAMSRTTSVRVIATPCLRYSPSSSELLTMVDPLRRSEGPGGETNAQGASAAHSESASLIACVVLELPPK
jgi:hypothetical protein